MLRKKLAKNMVIKYWIKTVQRKIFLIKVKKFDIKKLMKYDQKLFEKRHGRKLDWNNLRTYSEKMQWEKLFDNDPRKVICSDKFAVREWVKGKIGEEYLIPLIGVWDSAEDINFEKLPDQFVLKTNCGSGDVIIIRNKSELTEKQIRGYRAKLNYFLKMKFGYNTCELHYNKIYPKIIAESFIDSKSTDLQDYKFLCFNGKAHFCWVDIGRYHEHRRNIYNMKWELQEWHQYNYGIYEKDVEKPVNFEKMVMLAETLAEGFAHVRVDLYNVEGKIYFGEMTFTNSSGFEKIEPESADMMLGNLWEIDTSIKV